MDALHPLDSLLAGIKKFYSVILSAICERAVSAGRMTKGYFVLSVDPLGVIEGKKLLS